MIDLIVENLADRLSSSLMYLKNALLGQTHAHSVNSSVACRFRLVLA